MELTEEVLGTALDKGFEFLATKGIALKEKPKYVLMPGPHPELKRYAEVETAFSQQFGIKDLRSEISGFQTLYKLLFGLNISKKAIEEMFLPATNKIAAAQETDFKPKIRIYPKLQKVSKLENITEMFVHELWHIVESEHPITARTQSIREGTATYVQLDYLGYVSRQPPESYKDYSYMISFGVAYIVTEHLKHKKNPYQALLQHATRKRIEEETMKRIYGHSGSLIEMAKKEMTQRIRNKKPGEVTREFLKNPTKESIISVFRSQGANKFADELKRQDLTRLIAYYSSFRKPEEQK
jgi:hypothetical protein